MSVTFNIKGENKNNEIIKKTKKMDLIDTISQVKKYIIDELKDDTVYVDLKINIERPIRAFGKMNLEPGIFPRSMDNFAFNNFNVENKEIDCEFIIVSNYLPNVENDIKNNNPESIYRPPGSDIKKKEKVQTYNLESDTDFPAL